MIRTVPLRQLIESTKRGAQYFASGEVDSSREVGFHIYGEIRLSLKMTAAEDTNDAQRYLSILQDYASIANACANVAQAELLEVQGERIHVLMPCPRADRSAVDRVISFAISLSDLVYKKIGAKAGKEFQGFALAADHGEALLLHSGNGSSGSIISLGPAANAPAKRLGIAQDGTVKTPAQHLAMKSEILKAIGYVPESCEWTNIKVMDASIVFAHLSDADLTTRMNFSADDELARNPVPQSVISATSSYFSGPSYSPSQALKLSAFCLRADLDGFTREVQNAFDTGHTQKLLQRFIAITEFAKQFASMPDRKIISLPWAGDCANMIVLPKVVGESYSDAQMYVPAQIPAEWHSQVKGGGNMPNPASKAMGVSRWAVACVGGELEGESSPVILLATLRTTTRDFVIAAGWSVGRSADALEAQDVRGCDTVIAYEDYQALDSTYKELFVELDSRFWISRDLDVHRIKNKCAAASVQITGPYVPSARRNVPDPKPHWQHDD